LARRRALIVVRFRTRLDTRIKARLKPRLLARFKTRLDTRLNTRLLANLRARARVAPSRRRIAREIHRLDAAREHRAADRPRNASASAARRVARRSVLAPEPSE
jgi:hypothetical protein